MYTTITTMTLRLFLSIIIALYSLLYPHSTLYTHSILYYVTLIIYQAAWWGHPITTAVPTIDYYLSLDAEVLTAQAQYSEQLVRMMHINTVPLSAPYSCYLKRFKQSELLHLYHNNTNYTTNTTTTSSSMQHKSNLNEEGKDNFLRETLNDYITLEALQISPINSEISLVLGRLFKIHPDFDDILVSIIWELYLKSYYSRYLSMENLKLKNYYIILIAEQRKALNNIVFRRLLQKLEEKRKNYMNQSYMNTITTGSSSGSSSNTHHHPHHQQQIDFSATDFASAEEILAQHLRVVGYRHYHTLLRHSRVVLDTYPYGGKGYCCFYYSMVVADVGVVVIL